MRWVDDQGSAGPAAPRGLRRLSAKTAVRCCFSKTGQDTDPLPCCRCGRMDWCAGPASEANPNWRLQFRPAQPQLSYVPRGRIAGACFVGVTLLVFAGMKILDRRGGRSSPVGAGGRRCAEFAAQFRRHGISGTMTTMKPGEIRASVSIHRGMPGECGRNCLSCRSFAEPMPVPKPVDEAAARFADGVDAMEILPEQEARMKPSELSALEFTLSKDKAVVGCRSPWRFPAHVIPMYDIRGKAVTELTPDFARRRAGKSGRGLATLVRIWWGGRPGFAG